MKNPHRSSSRFALASLLPSFGRNPAAAALLAVSATLAASGAGCSSSPKAAPIGAAALESGDLRSSYDEGELDQLCQDSLKRAKQRMDSIARTAPAARDADTTLLAFEHATADLSEETGPLTFMKYVSPDPKTNAEGAKCEKDTGAFMVATLGRRDLYDAIRAARPRSAGEKRLLQKTLEAFEANGLKLPDAKLKEVTQLMDRLNELQNKFSENLNNDSTHIEATAEELEGVPADFLARLKKTADGGKYIVTAKAADYTQLMQNAKNAETRRRMAFAYNNRQAEPNTKLLEEAIQVRAKIAKLMGFRTWADYQLSHDRMAKNSKIVETFLSGLRSKLAKRAREDIQQLLKFKKTLDPKATKVTAWDLPYLAYQLQKKEYAIDNEKVREYFPSDKVVEAMFEVYSKLLSVRFEEVPDAKTWSPDVKLYKILDATPGKEGRLIAHFYTDFIPRQGKYSHFACFNIINARQLPEGYRKPVSAIVGNFNPPAPGKPSLLDHSEVVTLFHEFGHVMHQTLTTAPYASLSGSATARDFVEAPSQMLENWTWEKKILNELSGHYQDRSKKLPGEWLTKLIALRDYQQGYFYTRQLVFGTIDMAYHTASGPIDTTKVYDRTYKELLGVDPIEGGHFPASFGHLMGGYDAGYYGYLWSLVYATDMYTAFQKTSPLDAKTGGRYRREILERGNMVDGDVMLARFLGRPSNSQAFFKKLKIDGGK